MLDSTIRKSYFIVSINVSSFISRSVFTEAGNIYGYYEVSINVSSFISRSVF